MWTINLFAGAKRWKRDYTALQGDATASVLCYFTALRRIQWALFDLENPFCFAGQTSRYLARGEDHGTIDEQGVDTHATSYRSPPLPRTRRHSISHTVTAGNGGCDDPLPLIKFL